MTSTPFFLFLTINIFVTFSMTGIIWFVQVVHYPLFSSVGSEQFTAYEGLHKQLTTLVVAPLMLIELFTAIVLPFLAPDHPARIYSIVALILILGIFVITAIVQVPIHEKLSSAFSAGLVERLVYTNWIRTLLWSARSFVMVAILVGCLGGRG